MARCCFKWAKLNLISHLPWWLGLQAKSQKCRIWLVKYSDQQSKSQSGLQLSNLSSISVSFDLVFIMLRALSTRKSAHSYERLCDEAPVGLLDGELKRVTSLPARAFCSSSSSRKSNFQANSSEISQKKPANKCDKNQHPLFSLFYSRRRKKTTARPEFSRYIEFVKEGGLWDKSSNAPVIHYKP